MEIAERVEQLLAQMSVEEKALLCSGQDFWYVRGIKKRDLPGYMVCDGPHGLRKQETALGANGSRPATCFPPAVTMASTWNRDLIHEMGGNIAEEALEENVGIVLGPGVNIKRSPLCGRNFEYYSEDPYLAGQCAKSWILGAQEKGVGTSLKHYAVNSQENDRMRVNAVVDQRALREIYLAGFETAVKEARPYTLMAAYNQVNGEFASQNPQLLTQILRDEWGFEGYVMTDWGAIDDRVKGLMAGLDLEMPGGIAEFIKQIVDAVEDGSLPMEVLDRTVRRLLTIQLRVDANRKPGFQFDRDAHHAFARRAAQEGMVLLKNEDNLLPLKPEGELTIIGSLFDNVRYQGSGSSLINPIKVVSPKQGLEARGVAYRYAPGYDAIKDEPDEKQIAEAVDLARNAAGPIVVFLGLTIFYESEGYDRKHMLLPTNQLKLMEELGKLGKPMTAILYGGSPVELPWADDVKALLNAYLPGQAGGEALWDLVFGDVNPSGKLAESYPLTLADNPSYEVFPQGPATVEYRESIFVGYRFYDAAHKQVRFPFGHGLSYTQFAYSDLQIAGEGDAVTVTCKVKNVGACAGKEVVQLYVGLPESALFRAPKELKGFEKIALQPGEEKQVTFTLGRRAFSYWNVKDNDWKVEGGDYDILVGASSRDIRLQGKVTRAGDEAQQPYDMQKAAEYLAPTTHISDEAFVEVYGSVPPANVMDPKPLGWYHNANDAAAVTFLGKLMVFGMKIGGYFSANGNDENAKLRREFTSSMLFTTPFRSMATTNGGMLGKNAIAGFLTMLNGHFFKGLGQLFKGISTNSKYAKHIKHLQEDVPKEDEA